MKVNVNFTLDIDPAAWLERNNDPVTPGMALFRVEDEVRAHAENVVRDLFADMGWTIKCCTRCGLALTGVDTFGDYTDTEGQLRCTRIDGQPHRINV
jgi:hypothetical protein